MIFLNQAVLLGLAAVAIPILIHLIHRRKARTMDWGAMRFLLASLAARHRRTLIEELILMILRCLLVALLAMAMARPFLPSTSRVPWALVLPAVLVAAICAAVGAVMRTHRRARWALLALAGLLVVSAGLASTAEYVLQGRQWTPRRAGQDVAIVVDGSMSMTLVVGGRSNFERAVDEARTVVRTCRPTDAVSVVLAGPVPRKAVVGPTLDHELVLAALDTLTPVNGPMGLLAALDVAAAALTEGHNPAKKIVLITDGQNVGWETRSEARWQFLAGSFKQLPTPPHVICRTLSLPSQYSNIAIGDVTLSRPVVGTDRPVRIDVKVLNCSTATAAPSTVELVVDGSDPVRQKVEAIAQDAAETVHFERRFDSPGPHIIAARLPDQDDLPADDSAVRVVNVLERLPVLLIDGVPSARPLQSAASFMEVAMAPASRGAASRADLIEPTVIVATDVAGIRDLSPYRLVVLANVSRLPSLVARTLAVFVKDGGGLLIAPGDRSEPAFYNEWRAEGTRPLAPGRLAERVDAAGNPTGLGLKTFNHPAVALIAEPERSDADEATIDSYWRIEMDENDPSVRVGMRLKTGEPFLVERKVGKGSVLMTATSLGRGDSNLPTLKCFVPLVHELAYYLAAPTVTEANVRAGTPVTIELAAGTDVPGGKVEVVSPSNVR